MLNWDTGLNKIWTEDKERQLQYLEVFVRHIRSIPDEMKGKYVEHLASLQCFYVPHEYYMRQMWGAEIFEPKYGVYTYDEYCLYENRLVIPIKGLDGVTKALCGYDDGKDLYDSKDYIKYLYSPKTVWDKRNYMFITREQFTKSIEDGYIIVVDGLFDQISLSVLGLNAVSLMGSSLTRVNRNVLSFIPLKIPAGDNDEAGKKLIKQLQRAYPNKGEVVLLRQGQEWDIDDYIKHMDNHKILLDRVASIRKYGYYLG